MFIIEKNFKIVDNDFIIKNIYSSIKKVVSKIQIKIMFFLPFFFLLGWFFPIIPQ